MSHDHLAPSLLLLLSSVASAQAVPAGLFVDHAILQRDRALPVWGTAEPGEQVTVAFAGQTQRVTAGADGTWRVTLAALPASTEPRDLVISSDRGTPTTVHDVLVGEVWLASGQSNMEFLLKDCQGGPQDIAAADLPLLRHYFVPHRGELKPQTAVAGAWAVCSPATAGKFSGVGFYFARDLQRKLGIPVGLIHSSWGGTPAEAWTSREALATVPALKAQAEDLLARMAVAPALREAFPAKLAAWEKTNLVADDAGNQGLAQGWAKTDFDDQAWTTATVGFTVGKALKSDHGGVFWLRKAVDLPAESAGKGFQLELGWLAEQYDTVYFNGTEVGSIGRKPPQFYTAPRYYQIPGRLVTSGRNVIAVRFVSHTEKGALWQPSNKMRLPVADANAIDGVWKVAWERPFPPLSAAALAERPKLDTLQIQGTSTTLFNGMINPLVPYALRGAIWYQGENNANKEQAEGYRTLLPLMIGDWRSRWGQGDFPFYAVQLANNEAPVRTHANHPWSILREGQASILDALPNTGLAVAIDLGSDVTIHPLNKLDVGLRLARWARAKVYGEADLVHASPRYRDHTVEGKAIRVRFTTGGPPLMIGRKAGQDPAVEDPGGKLGWFEIAGADGKFAWAEAVIAGDDTVVVSSPEVSTPVAVRYAWAINPAGCNLYSKAGLPAVPFRTATERPLAK